MTNWRKIIPTFFAFAIVALCLPVVASAQYGGYGGYGNNGRNNNNYDRGLRDAIKRVKDRSGDFRKHLDRDLDHSRINGSNREDQINQLADSFHDAADDLKDHFGNGRDYGRSQQDARRLVQLGQQIERSIGRARLNSRSSAEWYQIRGDLSFIANAFGIDSRGYDDNGGRGRGRDRDRNQGSNGRWP